MHSIAPLLVFLFAAGAFAGAAWYARRSSIRLDGRCFDALLAALAPLDVDNLSLVAHHYLDPRPDHTAVEVMEPEAIWRMLGGEAGLKTMRANAALLLALAAHAAQWNESDGPIVAERMRRDAVRLRSAIRQIRIGMLSQMITGHHWVAVPFQLQEAAGAYYLMRQRLLALYETSHVGLLPRVAEAI